MVAHLKKPLKVLLLIRLIPILKQIISIQKSDSQINVQDIEDILIFVVSSFSTQTSYENQTKNL